MTNPDANFIRNFVRKIASDNVSCRIRHSMVFEPDDETQS